MAPGADPWAALGARPAPPADPWAALGARPAPPAAAAPDNPTAMANRELARLAAAKGTQPVPIRSMVPGTTATPLDHNAIQPIENPVAQGLTSASRRIADIGSAMFPDESQSPMNYSPFKHQEPANWAGLRPGALAGLVTAPYDQAKMAGKEIGSGDLGAGAVDTAGALAGALGLKEAVRVSPGLLPEEAGAAMRQSAEDSYARAVSPRTNAEKFTTDKTIAPGMADRRTFALTSGGLLKKAQQGAAASGQAVDNAVEDMIARHNTPNPNLKQLPPATVDIPLPASDPSPAPMAFDPQTGAFRKPGTGKMARVYGSDIAAAPPVQEAAPGTPAAWERPQVVRDAQGRVVSLPPRVDPTEPTVVMRDPASGRMGRAPVSQVRPAVPPTPEIPGTERPLPHPSEWDVAPRDERLATAIQSEPTSYGGVLRRPEPPVPGPSVEFPQVRTAPLHRALNKLKDSFVAKNNDGQTVAVDADGVHSVEQVQNILNQFGDSLSYRTLRNVRQIFDNTVARAKGFQGTTPKEGSLLEAKKSLADAARSVLAEDHPELTKVYAEYHFWKSMQDVLKNRERMNIGRGPSLGEGVSSATGAVIGSGLGHGIAGDFGGASTALALTKLFKSTAYKTLSGGIKGRLADAIASGSDTQVQSVLARALPAVAGSSLAVKHNPK